MNIRILAGAERDLLLGSMFYDAQGVGAHFLECLLSDIDELRILAGIHAKEFDFHRRIARKFPFTIYYDVREGSIDVYAILDCRQDPKSIEARLRGMQRERGGEG